MKRSIQAQPEEVTEAVTSTWYVTPKIIRLGEESFRLNYDAIGITLSDTGSGLFHQATIRVLGGFTVQKGKYNDEQAWGIYHLQNRDCIFFTATGTGERKLQEGSAGKGIATFTGGTGKCVGIKGSCTFTRYGLRPALDGTGQTYQKETINYTLP
jgi:hypothetical protein